MKPHDYDDLANRNAGITFVEAFCCLTVNTIALVGNVLVIMAVWRNDRLRTTTNQYIIALAITDLINAVFVMVPTTGVLVSGRWPYGERVCHMQAFFLSFVIYATPSIVGLAAFNRYVRMVKPNEYRRLFSAWKSRIYLASLWVLVVLYASVPKLTGLQTDDFDAQYAFCLGNYTSHTVQLAHVGLIFVIFLLLPIVAAITSYYKISSLINVHNLGVAPSLAGDAPRVTLHEIKVSKSLFAVVFAFIVCWVPTWATAVVVTVRSDEDVLRGVNLLGTSLLLINSAVNPFIYAGMNRAFRQEFKRILKCNHTNDINP